ncbi:cupredoxin domain-containing protein [Magnetofaba australis]|nr:hypothetical protein [Magnetofaba australis]
MNRAVTGWILPALAALMVQFGASTASAAPSLASWGLEGLLGEDKKEEVDPRWLRILKPDTRMVTIKPGESVTFELDWFPADKSPHWYAATAPRERVAIDSKSFTVRFAKPGVFFIGAQLGRKGPREVREIHVIDPKMPVTPLTILQPKAGRKFKVGERIALNADSGVGDVVWVLGNGREVRGTFVHVAYPEPGAYTLRAVEVNRMTGQVSEGEVEIVIE